MADVKLTKNELRSQQLKLVQLQRYLPTLQLKKALLQQEVNEARADVLKLRQEEQKAWESLQQQGPLLSGAVLYDPIRLVKVASIKKRFENIAGVEVPVLQEVSFEPISYSLLDTPAWLDPILEQLRSLRQSQLRIAVAEEKQQALEKELRAVSIRVNLFEKVLIPRASENIKDIKIFLGDQQLNAVARAKVAKAKINRDKATE